MARTVILTVAYVAAGSLAALGALRWHGLSPLGVGPAWIQLEPVSAHAYSAAIGFAVGLALIVATRLVVPRFSWAKALHAELRPFARGLGAAEIVALCLASSFGEELLFRGLLLPWLGVSLQALLFGVVHYLPGKSRSAWMGTAIVAGLAFGAIVRVTGSLAGAFIAHALINGVNLAYLKQHDPAPRRPLGGLLGQRS